MEKYFKMKGYDIMGKTGTAQYVNENTGKYYFDTLNYLIDHYYYLLY